MKLPLKTAIKIVAIIPKETFFIFFLNLLIFNWRIIALQYCVGFCQKININQPSVYLRSLLFQRPSHRHPILPV